MKIRITSDNIKELLNYNPDTGYFYWISSGKKATYISVVSKSKPYLRVKLSGIYYYAHRLAMVYMGIDIDKYEVDHINGDGTDNRWINLRKVSRGGNAKNLKMNKNNSSGLCGVVWQKREGNWRAQIKSNGKYFYLGEYDDIFEAACARKSAEKMHGFSSSHGRTNEQRKIIGC